MLKTLLALISRNSIAEAISRVTAFITAFSLLTPVRVTAALVLSILLLSLVFPLPIPSEDLSVRFVLVCIAVWVLQPNSPETK